ncbi:MAG: response regulator [Magnetococcales bacterium]|nr:response regulator [Magnetococcales bacterium]
MESILFVEDSKSFASLMTQRIQQKLDLNVLWAKSHAEAVALIESAQHPFLVGILDLVLPDAADGEIVTTCLAKGIRSAVLSGKYSKDVQASMLEKGILDYFIKDNIGVIDSVIHFISRLRRNGRFKVLVVDDSRAARRMVGQHLERHGFGLVEASDGAQALKIIQQQQIHLVITDFQMPGMDGLELTHKIRAHFSRDDMAVIGLSSVGDRDLAVRFIKSGANYYLPKPFRKEELSCLVSQTIENLERHQDMKSLLTRQQAILDNALDAIVVADDHGRMMDFNPAAETLFGKTKEDVLGHRFNTVVPTNNCDINRKGLDGCLKNLKQSGELQKRLEVRGRHSSGKPIDLEVSLTTIHHRQNRQFTAFLQDITQRKQLLKSLEETLSVAEESSKAKSEFIANTSHEIRTPMNAIMGFTELALKMDITARMRDYLRKVKNSSHTLMGLLDDVLDFSKIEAGRLELDPVSFRIHDVFDRLADLFSIQSEQKGVDLVYRIPPEFDTMLIGDDQRLEQVLINLIRNAIKFTDTGSIEVSATPKVKDAQTIEIVFAVKDSGIGIEQDRLPSLFDPFIQADGSTTRKYGGTGLGLTICKRLVGLMKGDIWAASTPGDGSTFSFSISFASRSEQREIAPCWLPDALLNMAVTVIDSRPLSRLLTAEILSALSLDVTSLAADEQALAHLNAIAIGAQACDLLLVDLDQPIMSDFETALVAGDAFPDPAFCPKIVLLTSFDTEQDIIEQMVDACLSRPPTRSRLRDVVLESFGEDSGQRSHDNRVLADEEDTTEKIGGARVLLVDDNAINREIGRELLERAGLEVEEAANGQEAVQKVALSEFQAVLMDIQMPVMDGFEAARQIRKVPRFVDLPIIAMTAHALKEDRKRCLDVGMTEHLAKPLRPKRLYGLLSRCIQLNSVKNDLTQDTAAPMVMAEIEGLDQVAGLAQVRGNHTLYRRLLLRFGQENIDTMATLQNALNQGDIEQAGGLLHAIKGVASGIGAVVLQQHAEALEEILRSDHPQERERLNSTLSAFETALTVLLNALKSLETTQSEADNVVEERREPIQVDKQQVAPLLQALVTLLEENSVETDSTMDKLSALLQDRAAQRLVARLQDRIEQYDFDQAIAILKRMAESMDIDINE